MTHAEYVKYGILTGFLLICTIMLSTTADSQAQITPASEKFGSDEASSSNDSPNNDAGDGDDGGSTGSSGANDEGDTGDGDDDGGQDMSSGEEQDDATEEEAIDTTGSNDVNNGQSTTEEQDFEETNPLMESIMKKVNEALSASGISGLGSNT